MGIALRTLGLAAAVLCGAVLLARPAHAHSGRSVSHSNLVVRGGELDVTLRLGEEDLGEVLALDTDRDGRLSAAEVDAGRALLGDYLRNNFVVRSRAPDAPPGVFTACVATLDQLLAPEGDGEKRRVEARLTVRCPALIDDVALRCLLFQGAGFWHEHRATVHLGGTTRLLLFDARTQEATVVVPLASQVGGYLLHGVQHILAGYDHLVFLFGLLLLGGTVRILLGIVTSFTVAHSVTLVLGALDVVSLPTVVVETAIAATIAYVGVENFFIKRLDRRWLLTFFLGLVHGFGFASALAESGLPTKGFLLTLFSFNVGVELGQVALVAAAWPLLRWATRQPWHRQVARALSLGVFLFGVTLFVLRAFFDMG